MLGNKYLAAGIGIILVLVAAYNIKFFSSKSRTPEITKVVKSDAVKSSEPIKNIEPFNHRVTKFLGFRTKCSLLSIFKSPSIRVSTILFSRVIEDSNLWFDDEFHKHDNPFPVYIRFAIRHAWVNRS